jgi:hypothetical protein
MPFHLNTIDEYQFEDIRGRLQPKAQQMEITVRAGVSGEAFRRTGVRAEPSQIQTLHYVADWDAARSAIQAYQALIDGNPYEIIQHTHTYGYFRIAKVTEVSAQAVENVVGSIIATPTVLHICQWTVISTEAPTP